MTFSLSGVAFVTGSASGIGKVVALAYAQAGASGLYLIDIDGKQLEQTIAEARDIRKNTNCEVAGQAVDITDEHAVLAAVSAAKEKFGRIDYAVNSAGISDTTPGSVAACSNDVFDKVLAVNLRGVFLSMKAEIKAMESQEPLLDPQGRPSQRGSVVNVVSDAAVIVLPGFPAYTTSKHALAGLTKSAAVEHAQSGIRVNGVCPGIIDTNFIEPLLADPAGRSGLEAACAMKRLGFPQEIADAILFLSSHHASFITGQNLQVDGGMTLS